MHYDYDHKKAEAVAEPREELFAEVVDIVSDESPVDVEMYLYAEDAETSKTVLFRTTQIIRKESKLLLPLFQHLFS